MMVYRNAMAARALYFGTVRYSATFLVRDRRVRGTDSEPKVLVLRGRFECMVSANDRVTVATVLKDTQKEVTR